MVVLLISSQISRIYTNYLIPSIAYENEQLEWMALARQANP
jgi:hypothetical protein